LNCSRSENKDINIVEEGVVKVNNRVRKLGNKKLRGNSTPHLIHIQYSAFDFNQEGRSSASTVKAAVKVVRCLS
jgi:hypothetical protein